jgi:hypothetical protein
MSHSWSIPRADASSWMFFVTMILVFLFLVI